ncbi:MAG: peptidase C39 family protein, partial [Vulcanimicrobiaceae bacterium]
VISWNATANEGSLSIRTRFADETWSEVLPYVSWNQQTRVSLGGREPRAHFEIDTLLASEPFTAIEAVSTTKLSGVALATPPETRPSDGVLEPIELDVPRLSQYVGDPGRGWCSPASLAMLLGANDVGIDVPQAAAATYDQAYRGTGNWAFNVAYASRFGLRAFVAYLRDLAHTRTFIAQGVPLALSLSWKNGELDDPPLPESDGHIVVLRGFDVNGDPIVNDPAQVTIRVTYPRAQFQRLWLAHGGVAYVIASLDKPTVDLANA